MVAGYSKVPVLLGHSAPERLLPRPAGVEHG
jgi:hypothetical protein